MNPCNMSSIYRLAWVETQGRKFKPRQSKLFWTRTSDLLHAKPRIAVLLYNK